jgi:hypothetical protein
MGCQRCTTSMLVISSPGVFGVILFLCSYVVMVQTRRLVVTYPSKVECRS